MHRVIWLLQTILARQLLSENLFLKFLHAAHTTNVIHPDHNLHLRIHGHLCLLFLHATLFHLFSSSATKSQCRSNTGEH